MVQRPAAWLVTGPIGHFVGGAVDWLALLAHIARARIAGREPW